MTGKAKNIDVHGDHVDGKDARRLRSIHQKENPRLPGNAPDPTDIREISSQIGCMVADDESGIGTDPTDKLLWINIPALISRDKTQPDAALIPEPVEGPQYGIMFQIRCDDMIVFFQDAVDGNIQGFR